jgi:hypothetical protein
VSAFVLHTKKGGCPLSLRKKGTAVFFDEKRGQAR